MTSGDSTSMGGLMRGFGRTRWSLLKALRDGSLGTHREVLDVLVRQYWKPVYYYLRRSGFSNEQAKDAVQGFFESAIEKDWFKKPDASRGRFRSFLLACLDNFTKNLRRYERAGIRSPPGGLTSLDALMDDADRAWEPPDEITPEDIYHRTWVADLAARVLNALERECQDTGKQAHYEILRRRIIEPALEGAAPAPMCRLAAELGMTEKQAANALLTARRAYQRLLREDVRSYALSDEDAEEEIRDIFRAFSR